MLASGEKLGPYEVLAPIGAGGMGEVYKARDTRLDRIVAIKTSQAKFSERFEREARAVAALNHPHICALYDVGPDYLVMEHVEGEPLTGPLPITQALEYAGQICDAMDAAHRQGIVHRDLKPGNILVGKNGVKILDFGLAKIERKDAPEQATATIPLTREGTILGTLQYMSPEQLEGQEADARSDIFALGLVLYEMISGRRAFSGKSQASLIAAILKEQPQPLKELEPLTPAALDRVIGTCLEKDPDKRWQSVRDVKHALEWSESEAAYAPAASSGGARKWQVIAAAMAILPLALAVWTFWPRTASPARVMRFEVPLPTPTPYTRYVSLSPDGRKLAFDATRVGEQGLWIRDLDSTEWRRLPGTENAGEFFWSPDSRFLAFPEGYELKKIDVAGGPPQTLCQLPYRLGTGAWNPDGTILFSGTDAGPLWRVSEAGGTPTEVTSVDSARGEVVHGIPSLLPDGKHFLYYILGSPGVTGIYVGSLDSKPAEQAKRRLLDTPFAASYVNGYLFSMRGDTLMAQPFDAGKRELQGNPAPVAEHVFTALPFGAFSASPSGVLAYLAERPAQNLQLTWYDLQGKPIGTVGEPGTYLGIALSPDGTHLAYRDADEGQAGDIWTLDLVRGVRTRLTFGHNPGSGPVWSPDGGRVAFSAGNLMDTLFEKDSSSAGDEHKLYHKPGEVIIPSDWSRDGRFLLYYTTSSPKTGADLWVLPLEGDRKPVLLLGTEFNEVGGVFSPDRRWIAYMSNESGRNEIYVRPFLASGPSGAPALGEGKWQVSSDGVGTPPEWRGDGKEISFGGPTNKVPSAMVVEVNGSGPVFQMGAPRLLFNLRFLPASGTRTADGKRLLASVPAGPQTTIPPITVILNWPALLKR